VLDAEEKARKLGKGLIILAQNMLQLGISLPCVSIVVLLDTGKDVDERIQKMYRALTQSPQKKDAFIVDLDFFRTFSAIAEYNIQAFQVRNKRQPQKEDREKIYNDIFNIYSFNDDTDMFATKHLKADQIEEIMKKMDEKEYRPPTDLKDGGQLMNQNVNATVEINAQFLDFVNPHTEKKSKKQQEEYIKKIEQRLKKAKPIKEDDKSNEGNESNTESEDSGGSEDSDANAEDNNDTAKMDKITREEAYRDIFKTLLRYGVFATENKSLESLKNDIANNSDTQDKIYDLLIKRGIIKSSLQKETLINQIILPNLNKFLAKEKEGSFEGMRSYVNDESKYPDQVQQVLAYINDHLAPKDKERKEFGEIYTPLSLVNEMLDKLPEGVWSNPNLKWLDPANGMGNFPILAFLRLCKGLKGKVKDHVKHIVENMLFMIDINGKNNDVARNLFKKLAPDATPNIEKIDDEKGFFAKKPLVFNKKTVTGFDIIMGNPPYNPPKTETGSSGNSIWQNFVIKSHSILNDKGYLLLVHPPGWKKPTDEIFKSEKFADGDYTGQIRQGQVWQVLKESGVFKFIYTNDQKSRAMGEDFIEHFPAVDYYLYQKGGDKTTCDTKNVFLGTIEDPKGVRLNYNLKYLPNLITKQTQEILHKITSKDGDKPEFKRFRASSGFSQDSSKKYKYFYIVNSKKERQYQYSDIYDENIDNNKVVMNWQGGIDTYYISYIKSDDKLGVFDKVMYTKVNSDKEGKHLEIFFKSDLVKFIFLITQYASGMRTVNEHFVANSITIPPEGTVDYYKFFDIEQYKEYIEDMLAHYEKFKAPKREGKTLKANNKNGVKKQRRTRKVKRT